MAYTTHGHHIPGTNRGEGITKAHLIPQCKGLTGPEKCQDCVQEAEIYNLRFMGTPVNHASRVIKLVTEHVLKRYSGADPPPFEVYIETFSFVLGNYKAHVCTTLDDGMAYWVVYDFNQRQTHITEYRRLAFITIPD
jgi:hypothetical protein